MANGAPCPPAAFRWWSQANGRNRQLQHIWLPRAIVVDVRLRFIRGLHLRFYPEVDEGEVAPEFIPVANGATCPPAAFRWWSQANGRNRQLQHIWLPRAIVVDVRLRFIRGLHLRSCPEVDEGEVAPEFIPVANGAPCPPATFRWWSQANRRNRQLQHIWKAQPLGRWVSEVLARQHLAYPIASTFQPTGKGSIRIDDAPKWRIAIFTELHQ